MILQIQIQLNSLSHILLFSFFRSDASVLYAGIYDQQKCGRAYPCSFFPGCAIVTEASKIRTSWEPAEIGRLNGVTWRSDANGRFLRSCYDTCTRCDPKAETLDARPHDEEESPISYGICRSNLKPIQTDLPFKVSERTVVIVKELLVV